MFTPPPIVQDIEMEIIEQSVHAKALKILELWAGFVWLARALEKFSKVQIFLAGGALRDIFGSENRKPKDFDFFIAGPGVEDFLDFLAHHGKLSMGPFGSPRWFPENSPDSYADIILIECFYNGLWKCEDIVDVLNQFDFTANAIALDIRTPRLFDPQNGIRDAQMRVMRAVRFDYPDEPISSCCSLSRPSVLWFRLIHYAKVLKLEIEPVTMRWLLENSRFSGDVEQFGEIFFLPNIELPFHAS